MMFIFTTTDGKKISVPHGNVEELVYHPEKKITVVNFRVGESLKAAWTDEDFEHLNRKLQDSAAG